MGGIMGGITGGITGGIMGGIRNEIKFYLKCMYMVMGSNKVKGRRRLGYRLKTLKRRGKNASPDSDTQNPQISVIAGILLIFNVVSLLLRFDTGYDET